MHWFLTSNHKQYTLSYLYKQHLKPYTQAGFEPGSSVPKADAIDRRIGSASRKIYSCNFDCNFNAKTQLFIGVVNYYIQCN
jgi:hypothetical protein